MQCPRKRPDQGQHPDNAALEVDITKPHFAKVLI